MAIIEQSSGLEKLAVRQFLTNFTANELSRGRFYLMKGRIPVTLNKIVAPNRFRVSDRLVQWNSNQIKISNENVLTTNASFALKSGTVSWFYWYRIDGATVHQMAGTVTTTPLNGDLEYNSVQVIKDSTYSISGLQFRLRKVFDDNEFNPVVPSPTPAPPTPEPVNPSLYVFPTSATWLVNAVIPSAGIYPESATWIVSGS